MTTWTEHRERIRQEIRREIELGILEPGEELISDIEAKDRGAPVIATGQALSSLAREGLLVRPSHQSIYVVVRSAMKEIVRE